MKRNYLTQIRQSLARASSKTALTILMAGAGTIVVSAQPVQLITYTNTVWKYRSNTNNPAYTPGDAWTAPTFDDSGWPSGQGLFGFESTANLYGAVGDFHTYIVPPNGVAAGNPIFPGQAGSPVSTGPTGAGTGAPSSYFRTHFNWSGSTENVTFITTNAVDDGIVVYLNGVEILNYNLPTTPRPVEWNRGFDGALGPGLLPGGANPAPFGEPSVFPTNNVPATGLVVGDNVIAVELHQSANGSSDDVFAMSLWGVAPFPPMLLDTTQPTNRVVLQSRRTILSALFSGWPVPDVQWYFQPGLTPGGTFTPIPDATNASYTITNMALANEGLYYALISNASGSTNTRTAVVQFTDDSTPPTLVRAIGSADFTHVVLEYSEEVDPITATADFTYTIGGNPVGIVSSTLLPGGAAVQLTLDAALAEDTLYTLQVAAGVTDLAGNAIPEESQIQFRSWTTAGCNGVVFETYSPLSTTDNNIATSLLASPDYPNHPQDTRIVSGFDSRLVYADNLKEGYGARLRGIFIPRVTGSYIFYLGSDDSSRLYLNTNGPAVAGKTLIVEETGCCSLWPERASAPQALIAGQGYYLEAIYKEGTGGDYGKVAARLQSEGPPLDDPETVVISTNSIAGDLVGYLAAPANIAGPLTLLRQPKSITNEATQPVILDATASNISGIICYQWQRSDNDGPFTDVAGAIGPIYSIPFPTVADDNGDKYRCLVRVPGSSVMSAEATLTLTADVTAPRVTRVVATSATSLAVYFSEPLGEGSTDAFNFTIDPGTSAVGDGVTNVNNPLRMDLPITPALTLGNIYNLNVGGGLGLIIDRATPPNVLSPDPTIVAFRAQVYTNNPDALVTLSTNGVLPIGALTERGILGRIVQVPGTDVANTNYIREQMLAGVYPNATNPMAATVFGGSFIETNAINYDRTAATNAAPFGHITPDLQFPGFPLLESTPDSFYNNMTMEAVCYVQLQQGIVRMGVNSDDGFTVAPALSITDPAATNILGQFEGGRGATDTIFDFYVEQDGLYPFRLMWEQGGGGANVEWWVLSGDETVYQPINSATNGPPAFVPPCSDKSIASQLVGSNLVVQWPDAGLGHLFVLQQSGALGSPTVWSNAVNIPQLIGGNRTATIPLQPGENRLFRLYKAGPPCP